MTWAQRVSKIEVGSKVAYSSAWLRSTGQGTGALPFARGIVTELKKMGETVIATIDWGDDEVPPRVNVVNLALVTRDRGIIE